MSCIVFANLLDGLVVLLHNQLLFSAVINFITEVLLQGQVVGSLPAQTLICFYISVVTESSPMRHWLNGWQNSSSGTAATGKMDDKQSTLSR